jgi:DNA-3-methyladenine glycosylase
MLSMRLSSNFFNRNTVQVAQDLLGKFLVHKKGDKIFSARITETEAYCGQKDLACHASKGLTPRTKVLFGAPGTTYVYLVYGMHHCLNFVTREEGQPEAVLIRAVDMENGGGPGKLCRLFGIDRSHNNLPLNNDMVWVEDRGEIVKRSAIVKTKRIGVDYAGPWKDKLWRFVLQSTHDTRVA